MRKFIIKNRIKRKYVKKKTTTGSDTLYKYAAFSLIPTILIVIFAFGFFTFIQQKNIARNQIHIEINPPDINMKPLINSVKNIIHTLNETPNTIYKTIINPVNAIASAFYIIMTDTYKTISYFTKSSGLVFHQIGTFIYNDFHYLLYITNFFSNSSYRIVSQTGSLILNSINILDSIINKSIKITDYIFRQSASGISKSIDICINFITSVITELIKTLITTFNTISATLNNFIENCLQFIKYLFQGSITTISSISSSVSNGLRFLYQSTYIICQSVILTVKNSIEFLIFLNISYNKFIVNITVLLFKTIITIGRTIAAYTIKFTNIIYTLAVFIIDALKNVFIWILNALKVLLLNIYKITIYIWNESVYRIKAAQTQLGDYIAELQNATDTQLTAYFEQFEPVSPYFEKVVGSIKKSAENFGNSTENIATYLSISLDDKHKKSICKGKFILITGKCM